MSNELERNLDWFKQCKPNPTLEDASTQTGVHYEEVSEMSGALSNFALMHHLTQIGDAYKAKDAAFLTGLKNMTDEQRIEDLDSLFDQITTAVGRAHMMGYDILGAMKEGNDSNFSKFEEGKPILYPNGKVAKGKNYFKPDMSKYIGKCPWTD
jgi:predicted HAD superfamily Cof-like phosphohydrolase